MQFGDKPIHNLYDFTDALRRSKVGDVVEVKVLRDGKPVTRQREAGTEEVSLQLACIGSEAVSSGQSEHVGVQVRLVSASR